MKLYTTVILPFVLYGCGTWSFMLRERQRLIVYDNRMFRNVFIFWRGKDASGGGIRQRRVAGSCEHGDEPSGSVKLTEFLNRLSVLLASQVGLLRGVL
jgi:hypothetical protein